MLARVLISPVQFISATLVTYLVIHALGLSNYAVIGLLLGLPALLGFVDLGSAAAVSNAAGSWWVERDSRLFAVLVRSTRVTLAMGIGLSLAAIVIAVLGLWPPLLGSGDPDLLSSGAIVVMIGMAALQPLLQGSSVLMATGDTVAATLIGGAVSLVTLALVWSCTLLTAPPIAYIAVPFAAQIAIAFIAVTRASRRVGISLSALARAVVAPSVRGAKIGHEARPALVIWIMLPIAYQTDRLLISHLSTSSQLASYNVAFQLFAGGFAVIAAGSGALWGHFSRARAARTLPDRQEFVRLTLAFSSVGVGLGAAYVLCASTVASWVSAGGVRLSIWLIVGFAVLMVVQAFHQPSAMIQTDAHGLRFNAGLVVLMTVLNLALGLLLTPILGAAGPVLASVVALSSALALPSFVRAVRVVATPASAEAASADWTTVSRG